MTDSPGTNLSGSCAPKRLWGKTVATPQIEFGRKKLCDFLGFCACHSASYADDSYCHYVLVVFAFAGAGPDFPPGHARSNEMAVVPARHDHRVQWVVGGLLRQSPF